MDGSSAFPRPAIRWTLVGCVLVALVATFYGCQREREQLLDQFETAARPELRAGAIERLGEMGQEDDFALFLKAARDSAAIVREKAAGALAQSGDPRAIDPLAELLADPVPEVQAVAAAGLARFNTDKSRAYLLNAYGRQGGPARKAIAGAIGVPTLVEAVRHEAQVLWDRNLKALESGGPAERVGAAEELGRSGRSDAVERLLTLLGDDSVLLAAAAARGLGSAKDKRAVAPLMAILKEDLPMLREAAAETLGQLGDPAAVPALEKLARDGGPSSTAAVRALGHLVSEQAAWEALCRLASEAGLEVAVSSARVALPREACPAAPVVARLGRGGAEARTALGVLEVIGGSTGADRVLALLSSQDAELRLAAARAVAVMQAPEAERKVLELLTAESARLERARQKWIAGPLPLVDTLPPPEEDDHGHGHEDGALLPAGRDRSGKFKEMLDKVDALNAARAEATGSRVVAREPRAPVEVLEDFPAGDEALLLALTQAAGRLKSAGALPVLLGLAKDPMPAIRGAACEAFGALATPEALAAAGACLEDSTLTVVRAAARGLQRAGEAGVPVLSAALAKRPTERAELIRALGVLGAKSAAPAIVPLLKVGGLESIEAAVALGRIGDRAHAMALAEQLADRTGVARLEVIAALGELAEPTTLTAVVQELFSERAEVRAAAARALKKFGARGGDGDVLAALRFDYYAEVRRAAEDVLGPDGGAH